MSSSTVAGILNHQCSRQRELAGSGLSGFGAPKGKIERVLVRTPSSHIIHPNFPQIAISVFLEKSPLFTVVVAMDRYLHARHFVPEDN